MNESLPFYVFVSNPAHIPVPTGTVTVSFGDGSSETDALTNGLAVTNHSYASTGPVTINAAYNGDGNFGALTTSQSRVVLATAPPSVTFNFFGSSSTTGFGASSTSARYVNLVAAANDYGVANYGVPGFVVANETPYEYGLQITPQTYSSLLIGTNEIATVGPSAIAGAEYTAALTADYAWLLVANDTAEKVLAQDALVVQTGSWAVSDVYSAMGLKSTSAGSTLAFTLPGSTLYVALSTRAADAVYSVTLDGNVVGRYQPTTLIGTPEVYGVRLPIAGSSLTTKHTVTVACVNPGSNGCYVDFVSSNGATAPMQPPYLWTMSPMNPLLGNPQAWYDEEAAYVKALTAQFASDGFTIAYGDLDYRFAGPATPQCIASDNTHPSDCGHQLIAATLLAAMDNVASALQRISFNPLPPTPAVASVALQATATSGLPVTFTVDSGPAVIQGQTLTATAAGAVKVTAHQGGSQIFLPAPDVTQQITFTGADPGLQMSIPNHTFGDAPFKLTATTSSSGGITYSVSAGPAKLSGTTLTMTGAGNVTVNATQQAAAPYAAAVQSYTFSVAPATPVIQWTPTSSSLVGGGTLGAGILDAQASVAGSFTYTATQAGGSALPVTASTILAPGIYTLDATFVPADSTDYLTTSSSAPLSVQAQHIWIANANGSVSVMDETGHPSNAAVSAGGQGIAIDSLGNAWSLSREANSLTRVSVQGSSSVVTSYSGGGLNAATALAIDGGQQIWVSNGQGSVSLFSNAGTPLSGSDGFMGGGISSPSGLAIDTSGNVWVANAGNDSVTEILGGAVPVVPLAMAVTMDAVAVKP